MNHYRKVPLICAVYLAGTLLTFGHEAARFEREATNPIEKSVAGPKAMCTALIWPGYWPFLLSWRAFE